MTLECIAWLCPNVRNRLVKIREDISCTNEVAMLRTSCATSLGLQS